MRSRTLFVTIAAAVAFASAALPAQDAAEPVTAFVNVNVVPMDRERIQEDWTVVVRGDRIVASGPSAAARVPEDATVIDGTGRFLLPGLGEMHGHIPPPTADPAFTESVLFLYVANGVINVPGFSIHHEMQRMVEAGMSPYDVLRSGTAAVGRYLWDQDYFGFVAIGQRADLLLLEANPLEDVGNVADRTGVMLRGRWLPEEDLQARLEEIAATYRTGP